MAAKRLFAQGTTVQIARSRAEIEKLVLKHGASSYASGYEGDRANILFKMKDRRVRFTLVLERPSAPKAEEENRRRWRCLVFILKAKLEAVENGLVTFEEEFLSAIVIPGAHGETVGQWVGPQLKQAYENGAAMPPLLGAGT